VVELPASLDFLGLELLLHSQRLAQYKRPCHIHRGIRTRDGQTTTVAHPMLTIAIAIAVTDGASQILRRDIEIMAKDGVFRYLKEEPDIQTGTGTGIGIGIEIVTEAMAARNGTGTTALGRHHDNLQPPAYLRRTQPHPVPLKGHLPLLDQRLREVVMPIISPAAWMLQKRLPSLPL
jgi:hypothetical protein